MQFFIGFGALVIALCYAWVWSNSHAGATWRANEAAKREQQKIGFRGSIIPSVEPAVVIVQQLVRGAAQKKRRRA
jgi:hypothetical protein